MKPTNFPTNFSADFRRFHRGKSFSHRELALIESLERQRHRTGRVRAVIDDPAARLTPVLLAYLTYIRHLDKRDAILISPRSSSVAPMLGRTPGVLTATPRTCLRILGTPRPIGQILLLDTHVYPRLDQTLSLLIPYANGPNSLLIIHGTTKTPKPTRFQHWLALAATPTSIYHLPPRPKKPRPQKFVPVRAACGEKIHNSKFIIHNTPNPPSPKAIPIRIAPLKIAA